MLSTIFKSNQVAHILSLTIQAEGTTLISPGSRTSPRIKEELVTPPKLALANPMELLAIHPVKPTCGQIGNYPHKNCQSKCKEGE
jgi:hypothetical protein